MLENVRTIPNLAKGGDVKNRKEKRKFVGPIPEETFSSLIEIFSPNELDDIHQLILTLRKMRKVDGAAPDIREQIDKILEVEYFYVCDFIVEHNWQTNKPKIEALWGMLRKQLA
jgi:hypothetical protein